MTDDLTLRAQIEETFTFVPPEVDAMIDRLVDGLRDSGATPGLPLGAPAPDFTAPDAEGAAVTLSDRLARGPVVLAFYRGDWCPVCNLELRALQRVLPEITAAGAALVAISPQAPDRGAALVDQHALGFTVCSDVDQSIASAYGLKFTLSDELRDLYEQFDMPLTRTNADGSWDLPVPATFVIDVDGVVRARHVDPDYRTRMEPSAVVAAVQALHEERRARP
jgi:peroxiredoxin